MKNYIIGIVFFAGVFLSSCGDQLDLEPANSITDEQISELLESGDEDDKARVISYIANYMPPLFNASKKSSAGSADGRYYTCQGLDCMRNLEGNDIVFGRTTLSSFGADEYLLRDFISQSVDKNMYYWHHMWTLITTANKLLNLLDDESVGDNTSLKEYKARGLVIRAYAYAYLMENYQDSYLQGGKDKLGLMLYDYYNPIQDYKARSSSEETYAFIKKDLNDAVTLLEEAGVGYTSDLTDIDMAVVKFILARVSLITGDWVTAISVCDDILANYPDLMGQDVYGGVNNVGTETDPEIRPETNGFLYNDVNPEAILGWSAGTALTAHNGWMNPFGEGRGGEGECFARIDNRLYEKIDANDYRKDCFMATDFGDYTYPTSSTVKYIPAYTNLKFAATHGVDTDDKKKVGTVSCYYMRSSEVLLMKAEAQAQNNNESGAKTTLNTLLAARTRSGETALTCNTYSSMSGLSALEMVQLQTRLELWGEGGREFFNNKRWNIPVDRTNSDNHVDKSTYSIADMTCQIPDEEMLYNPLCEQN